MIVLLCVPSHGIEHILRTIKEFLTRHPEVVCIYPTHPNPHVVDAISMNVGFIPKGHWLQTDVGAGRLIGEACHIFELFCFLTDAQPVAVSVETLRSSDENLFPTDNFSAQISFSDGSICTLVYTSIGHARMGKERMELFFDSKAIMMNDYLELQGFGLTPWFDEIVTTPNKGHEVLLKTFFEGIRSSQVQQPMSMQYLCMIAELTLVIDQLACQGGGVKEFSTLGMR